MCRAMRDRVQRLQAVHDKFRAVVDEGERMPSTWSEAKPQHRQAFENFFAGWKPLPPSMSQPQRKLQTRAPADGTTRGGARRGPTVKVEDAPVVRSPGCVAACVRAGTHCACRMWNVSAIWWLWCRHGRQPLRARAPLHSTRRRLCRRRLRTLWWRSRRKLLPYRLHLRQRHSSLHRPQHKPWTMHNRQVQQRRCIHCRWSRRRCQHAWA